jgi:hypothetical protein
VGALAIDGRAATAKFEQNTSAREALLSTDDRPLTHQMKNDSKTIPGAILAEIQMRTRASLRQPTRRVASAKKEKRRSPSTDTAAPLFRVDLNHRPPMPEGGRSTN